MTKEQEYIEDKVYLRGPTGRIYPYEPLVANQPGFVAVVPNKSEATLAKEKAEADAVAKADEKAAAEAEAAGRAAMAEQAKAEREEANRANAARTENAKNKSK